jgi:hypothetical protein
LVPWHSISGCVSTSRMSLRTLFFSDWLDNSWWLDVKLLVDPSGGELAREISNYS